MPDVILPVLDEAEAIPDVLAAIPAGYHPIVVDNGSTDRSGEIAAECGAEVVTESRRGFGSACCAGLTAATRDVVCFMDCDGSLDPADLLSLEAAFTDGADLVLGARRPEPGAWPAHARFANRVLAFEMRRRTGLALSDLGPMRMTAREALIGLGLQDRRSGWPLEMVLKAAAADWKIVEVPVPLKGRSGRSKVTGTVRGTAQAIRDMSAQLRAMERA
ncbi:MAG: glycosyltransferase family 2 protein [Acidobacteriota bacterium]